MSKDIRYLEVGYPFKGQPKQLTISPSQNSAYVILAKNSLVRPDYSSTDLEHCFNQTFSKAKPWWALGPWVSLRGHAVTDVVQGSHIICIESLLTLLIEAAWHGRQLIIDAILL